LFTGADDIYKSNWFAFDKLKFLLNRRAPRRTSNTVSTLKKIKFIIILK